MCEALTSCSFSSSTLSLSPHRHPFFIRLGKSPSSHFIRYNKSHLQVHWYVLLRTQKSISTVSRSCIDHEILTCTLLPPCLESVSPCMYVSLTDSLTHSRAPLCLSLTHSVLRALRLSILPSEHRSQTNKYHTLIGSCGFLSVKKHSSGLGRHGNTVYDTGNT